MPKIKVNNINMYYEIHGEGRPLVLVSGFSADHLGWTPVLGALSKKYQVILFNNRGAGQTDVPSGVYSIEQMAHDIFSLCKALNIFNADFIGNSMGGFLVQQLAYQYPALTRSIVISNSVMSRSSSVFQIYADAQLELIKANAPSEALCKIGISWCFSWDYLSQPGKLEALIQLSKSNPHPFTVTGYEGQLAAIKTFDARPWIKKIKAPTLVVTGDEDIIFFHALSKKIAAAIPNAKFHCFEKCGHIPHIEHPEEYVRVVTNFHSRF